jgi:3-carboxy-cis,cis-muconate cycloisomerase
MTSASPLFPGFSTEAVDRIWSPESRVKAMLRFEEALALALADAGIAPPEEAEEAAAACRTGTSDPEAILAATWEKGTPVVALLEEMDERRWLHHGATTQDTVDSAHMLLARQSLDVLEGEIVRACRAMAELAAEHRDQAHMARTFLQPAQPTTFGRRVAGWLEPLLGHLEGIRQARQSLAVQLGGPVGDRSAYGKAASDVVAALAKRLGLAATPLAWHADRSRIWSLVEAVGAPVRTMAKAARDLALLAGAGEVTMRAGGSSSMAGKRNPIDVMRAAAAAEAFRGAAAMITDVAPPELERGLGSWHVEWFALPLVFGTASAVFEATAAALESLQVDAEAMTAPVPAGHMVPGGADVDAVVARFEELVGGP